MSLPLLSSVYFLSSLTIFLPPLSRPVRRAATTPRMHRDADGTDRRAPDGRRIRVRLPSSEWPTMMHDVPDALASFERSPSFSSTLDTTVPSGSLPTGHTFPTSSCAVFPQ